VKPAVSPEPEDSAPLHFVPFTLTAPSPVPEFLNVHYICESASRLLLLSVHWARNIPAFQALSRELRVRLVRTAWAEVLTLGLAQCARTLGLATILTAITGQLAARRRAGHMPQDKFAEMYEYVARVQELVTALGELRCDEQEYSYLKTLLLFANDRVPSGDPERRKVQAAQHRACAELRRHCEAAHPGQPDRCSRLLLLLLSARGLSAGILEELFFGGLIGNFQIDAIIPFIMEMEMSNDNR